MVDNSQDNVQFTDEQHRQLYAYESRLTNFKMQIDIHTRNIEVLKLENIELEKTKTLLQDQIASLQGTSAELEKSVGELKTQSVEQQKELQTASVELQKERDDANTKSQEIVSQKASLDALQVQIQADRASLSKLLEENNKVSQELAQKKSVLTDAISKL